MEEGEGAVSSALFSASEDEVICLALDPRQLALSAETLGKVHASLAWRRREAFSLAL